MSDLTATVTNIDGQPCTTSLDVAEKFDKKHQHVLEAIRKILDDLGEGNISQSEDFGRSNFRQSSYINEQGKEQPMYHLTRDAFSLLAMGFTGKKALAWKVRYIEAFNAMEAELMGKSEKKARKVNGRKAKAIPQAEPTLADKGMETMKKIMRLRAEVFEASIEVQNVLARPFWHYKEEWFAERMKAFAKELNDTTGAFFMAINHNMIAVEHMFRAYIEAEKIVIHQ